MHSENAIKWVSEFQSDKKSSEILRSIKIILIQNIYKGANSKNNRGGDLMEKDTIDEFDDDDEDFDDTEEFDEEE